MANKAKLHEILAVEKARTGQVKTLLEDTSRKFNKAADYFSGHLKSLKLIKDDPANADAVPEYFLNRFFQQLGTPYRAYEAENPEALQKAVDDVNRLENLPITYFDTVPRRDLSQVCYGVALGCVLLLLGANLMEIRRWA